VDVALFRLAGANAVVFAVLHLFFVGPKAVFAFATNNYIPLGQWNSNSLLENQGAGGL